MTNLLFKRLDPDAILPTRANPWDAGCDLYSKWGGSIGPGGRMVVKTGLAVAIPEGYYGRIAPRSGLAAKAGVQVGGGVIDSTYRGEIKVLLFNHGSEPFQFEPGHRIAQLLVEKIAMPKPEWADELPESTRGELGFGSSGL